MSDAPSSNPLVDDSSDFSFKDFEFTAEDDEDMDEKTCPMIKVTKSKILEWFQPWKKALVVKLIGKNLIPYIITEQVKYLWRIKSEMFPTDIGNGYIVFQIF